MGVCASPPLAALLLLLLGAALAGAQETPDAPSADDCFAMTVAQADPDSNFAEAVSNAVASTFSEAINCNDSTPLNTTDTEALSFAVSIAIAGTSDAAQECAADAEAAANITSQVVAEEVKSALNNATNMTTGEGKIAGARADALEEDVMAAIMETTQPGCPADQPDPCIVPLALPMPEEVAELIETAIADILKEIQCGEGDGSGEECKFVNGEFLGDCFVEKPEPPAEETDGEEEPRCLFLNGRLIC